MATTASPGIITSGLTFYYDMYNTSKSYYGPPANNGITFAYNLLSGTFLNTGITVAINSNIVAPSVFSKPTNNNAWAVNESSTVSGKHNISFPGTSVVGTVYILSIYAKAKERSRIYITQGSEGETVFDLATGTVVSTGGNSATTITHVGNGWYRCSAAITATTTTGGHFFGIWNGASTYAGTVGYGVYMCNPQRDVTPNYLTPFITNDIRSNTNNLYDIVTGAPITTSSLTYASDNTFSFNGTSNYMDAGNATGLQQSTAITMDAWVRPTSFTTTGNIMSKNGNTGYRFRIDSDGTIQFLVDGANNVLIGPVAAANVWQHITVTGNSGGLKIYRNGILVASNAIPFAPSAPTGGTLVIGGFTAGSELFTGSIATGTMYSRALTSAEILQNFNALRGRFGV